MGSGVSSSMALALAGFCFSVLFIVFVCTRLACALLRRRRRQARARLAAAPPLPHYAHGYADPDPFPSFRAARRHHHHHHAPGLDPAAFPTRAYAAAQASDSDDGSQCVICLAEYEEGDELRVLPPCSHTFHTGCISLWLAQNSTCPVCRVSLLVPDTSTTPESEHSAPHPPPPPPPHHLSSIVIISPPSSPEPSRSDPCRCLFASGGHSSRAADAPPPPRHEPDQGVSGPPPADGASGYSSPLPEVINPAPAPETNGQTVRKQAGRSTTPLGPCK